jgi:hypothetical protein
MRISTDLLTCNKEFGPISMDQESNHSTRCRIYLLIAALGCLMAIVGWLQSHLKGEEVAFTEMDCERLQIGMTSEQVQKALENPPGNYATDPLLSYPTSAGDWGAIEWISDQGEIRVWFDQFDKVRKVQFRSVPVLRRSWLERNIDRVSVCLGL